MLDFHRFSRTGRSSTKTKPSKKAKPNSKLKPDPSKSKQKKIRRISKTEREFLALDYRFKNNTEEWFAVMLRDGCDLQENYHLLQYEIEDVFGQDAEYFLPVYVEKVDKKLVGIILFDGYVFIKRSDTVHEGCLTRKTECLDGVLKGNRRQRPLTNRDINRFKTRLRHELMNRAPKRGDRVRALEGTFKNMVGKVLSVRKSSKTARIKFEKKTRIVEDVLSIVNFEIIEE
jgi:transcription antitermination factor NusG